MRLTGKTALITGAASGIGAATARRFVEEGARVCVADVLEAEGVAIAESLGARAFFHRLDVTDEALWGAAVNATIDRFGRLDVLVNNAGTGAGTLDFFEEAAWTRLIAINTRGPFLGIKTAVPHMLAQGGGSIVNIASIAGKIGMGVHLGYPSSKGAVLAMSKSAAIRFASQRIRVNAILPGIMPMMRNSLADPAGRQKMLDGIPMGRIGDTADIADAVLFLASDEAKYITGVELPVDGGYLAK